MNISKLIKNSTFAIYGLGLSGRSTFKFLSKNSKKKIYAWDDNKIKIPKKNLICLKKY
jgi:UDP-N-acetylmuramoylalanine-D-glutamate ligase